MNNKGVPRERTFVAIPKCRYVRCRRDAVPGRRGLCRSCYQQVWKKVRKDHIWEWQELEAKGKVAPVYTFDDWLNS